MSYFTSAMASSKKKIEQVSLARKTRRRLKKFTKEQKLEAVWRVIITGEAKTHVGKSIGVRESTLRGWVKKMLKEGRVPGLGLPRRQEKKTPEVIEKKAALVAPTAEEITPKVIECEIASFASSAATEDEVQKIIETKAELLDEKESNVYVVPLTPPSSPETVAVCDMSKKRPRTTSFSTNEERERIGDVASAESEKQEQIHPEPEQLQPNGTRCRDLFAPGAIEELFESLGNISLMPKGRRFPAWFQADLDVEIQRCFG